MTSTPGGAGSGVLAPRYRSVCTGAVAEDPLRVAGQAPVVDVAALARLFTGPALTGEFTPGAFWRGVRLDWPPPDPCPPGGWLFSLFAEAVAGLCAGTETVGVKLSGGLDSLAVLCQLAALRPARRLVAYCVDLTDDQGIRCADVVRALLHRVRKATGNTVKLVLIDPTEQIAAPAWSPHGPRLDALPAANAAIAEHAAAGGVQVLFHGDGADELLGVPSYATVPILAAYGPRAAGRYLGDHCRSGPGWVGELLAAAVDRFPRRARARWYWAANWPTWCTPTVSPVVAVPQREQAVAFADEWISSRLAEHVERGRRWAAADAVDAFWPRAYLPSAGPVPEASPFLTEPFAAAAMALPIAARYDPRLPSAYQRYKAAVVSLLPAWIHPVLPRRKQYFTHALTETTTADLAVPRAATAGLLDPAALAACADTATRMTAAAVETWLAGAHAARYTIPNIGCEQTNRATGARPRV